MTAPPLGAALRFEPTRIERVDVATRQLTLREPHQASWGVVHERHVAYVHVVTEAADGWSELATLDEPRYQPDWTAAAITLIRELVGPRLVGVSATWLDVYRQLSSEIAGNHPVVAAVADAMLDAQLRARATSLAAALGVARGPRWGLTASWTDPGLLDRLAAAQEAGLGRLKLKLSVGDVDRGDEVLATIDVIREQAPAVILAIDANGRLAPDPATMGLLRALARAGVTAIEQPFAPSNWAGARELAQHLGDSATLVVADEAASHPDAVAALLDHYAATAICIKPGPLGGIAAALAVVEACRARSVPHWCGGLLESSVGRACLVSLAALTPDTPVDFGPSSGYYTNDASAPTLLGPDGRLALWFEPGIGPAPALPAPALPAS